MGRPTKMEKLGIVDSLRNAYQGKKVFLTGHTGFKGAWMLLFLRELGAEVTGYSLAPKHGNDLFHLIDGSTYCNHIEGDIRNRKRLADAIEAADPDFVFHLAAQALVLDSYDIPVETYDTNVMGTIHTVDAMRSLNGKPRFGIIITTDKVYENQERIEPYAENERLGGFDPYSNSKACAELATQSYRDSFFNPAKFDSHQTSIATARSGNVIGGGDWSANRIIPDLVRALQNGEELVMRNPSAIRPWQHVLDPIYAYLLLGTRMQENPIRFADAFNFGPRPSDELTVQQLVEIAIDRWGSGTYNTPELANQPHEAKLLKLAIEKAKEQLGWEPQFTAAEAIAETIDWYATYKGNPYQTTLNQIQNYLTRLG